MCFLQEKKKIEKIIKLKNKENKKKNNNKNKRKEISEKTIKGIND